MTSLFIESFWHLSQSSTFGSVEPTCLIRSSTYVGNANTSGIATGLRNSRISRHSNGKSATEWLPSVVKLNLGRALAKIVFESVCTGQPFSRFMITLWYGLETEQAARHLIAGWEERSNEILSEDSITEQLADFRWSLPRFDQPIARQRVEVFGQYPFVHLGGNNPRVIFFTKRCAAGQTPNLVGVDPIGQPNPTIDVPRTGSDVTDWFSVKTYEVFL